MTAPLVRRSPAHSARVLAARDLTPRMRRVTISCPALAEVRVRPAQDIELLLREESGRRVKRRYTVCAQRADEVDLDVLLHGAGPGSRWGASAAPGDEVHFQGPRGKLELRPAPLHLLVGDESALPAITAIAAALPAGESALALVEVCDAADELPPGCDVRWVHRGPAAAGDAALLLDAVGALPALPVGARGYLMGESRAMITLRPVVEALGVAHEAMFVKGYWNVGRPDRLANRPPA